eukprot:15445636-Heterocapsa_arctica.AAC.1
MTRMTGIALLREKRVRKQEKEDMNHDNNDNDGFAKGKMFSRVSPGRTVRFPNDPAFAIQLRGMEEHRPLLTSM